MELNVSHPLVRHMDALKAADEFQELALLLYDQATLTEEGQVANPADFSSPAEPSAGEARGGPLTARSVACANLGACRLTMCEVRSMSTNPPEDAQLRARLTPLQYQVTQKKGTEPAFTGKYAYNKDNGVYSCVCCGQELFSSDTKYDSGSGWPSFWLPLAADRVRTHVDSSPRHGAHRGHLRALRRASGPRI